MNMSANVFRRLARTTLIVIAGGGVVAAGGGFLLAWSGLLDVAATSRHGPLVAWFLHYSMRQSVRYHAADIVPPPLDDPVPVLQGAAYYQTGCAPCHGSPGNLPSAIEKNAEPPPPPLYAAFATWRPRELFWIVKHGVKMTAMPPWPAHARDDEVWAIVALLLELPKLDAASYRRLAFGTDDVPATEASGLPSLARPNGAAVANCARCHGFDGRGRSGAFPRLAGLSAEYLGHSLQAFRSGARISGFMRPVATGLDDTDTQRVVTYFSGLGSAGPATASRVENEDQAALRKHGADIARFGLISGRIPPCLACHDPAAGVRNPAVPDLASQTQRYLRRQLLLFRQGLRIETDDAGSMTKIAQALTTEQISAVAAYFASLNP